MSSPETGAGGDPPNPPPPPPPPPLPPQPRGPPAKHPGVKSQKEMTKAERRELQERQRALKAAKTTPGQPRGPPSAPASKRLEKGGSGGPSEEKLSISTAQGGGQKRANVREPQEEVKLVHSKIVHLFSHLQNYAGKTPVQKIIRDLKVPLHPSILTVGLKFSEGTLRGTNARTAAMLLAFKDVIMSYTPPPDKVFSRDLDKVIKPHIQYLVDCRPHSIAMGTCIKYVRSLIANSKPDITEAEAKANICKSIDTFIEERIIRAAQQIAHLGVDKISEGDVVLTFSRSFSVVSILKEAKKKGKNFRVIIVDSRPLMEGKRTLKELSDAGIKCTYLILGAISYVMRSVSKVFLGSAALLSNGAVVSRGGTALVAMVARRFNIPVIFCAETYKLSDKVQLDSIHWNEIGDPQELVRSERNAGGGPAVLEKHKEIPSLKLLNIRYDLTPIKYVSMVLTEGGAIPPTSVPVLIREEKQSREEGLDEGFYDFF